MRRAIFFSLGPPGHEHLRGMCRHILAGRQWLEGWASREGARFRIDALNEIGVTKNLATFIEVELAEVWLARA